MLTENQNLIILKSLLYELNYRRDNKLMKVQLELNICRLEIGAQHVILLWRSFVLHTI